MKNIFLFSFGSALVLLTVAVSCNKEDLNPEYPFTIQVKTYDDSVAVQGVYVEIGAPVSGSVFEELEMYGSTDVNGEVHFKYDKDATLRIQATRGQPPYYDWIGCNYVRLEPNVDVHQTVYLEVGSNKAEGCFAP